MFLHLDTGLVHENVEFRVLLQILLLHPIMDHPLHTRAVGSNGECRVLLHVPISSRLDDLSVRLQPWGLSFLRPAYLLP